MLPDMNDIKNTGDLKLIIVPTVSSESIASHRISHDGSRDASPQSRGTQSSKECSPPSPIAFQELRAEGIGLTSPVKSNRSETRSPIKSANKVNGDQQKEQKEQGEENDSESSPWPHRFVTYNFINSVYFRPSHEQKCDRTHYQLYIHNIIPKQY